MAPGLLPARSSKCVACLVMVAGAALGTVGGEAYAGGQAGSPVGAVSPRPSTDAPDAPSAPPPPPPPAAAGPSALPSAPPSALPSGPATLRPASSGALASSEAATPSGASDDAPSKPPGGPSASASAPAAPSPAASASASEPPLAGQVAGEGRARPGRSLSPLELARAEAPLDEDVPEPDAADVPVHTPPPSAFPEYRQASAQALDARAVRQVQQISLGAGIALVGLGLGFLAFRMRRGH